ncbi:elongation factor 2-like protein [Tanacetum coccineum]
MLKRAVDYTNVVLATYKDSHLGDVMVSRRKAPIFQQDESEIRKRLWGDHFHDSETDEWTEKHTGAASCVRGKKVDDKHLMKCVMNKWLPASTTLLEMCIVHFPSPHEAQSYCVENLYKGPGDDDYAQGIRNCDTRAPLKLYVSKMFPTHVKGEFFAYGRVFSGIVGNGSRVRIMGPYGVHGEEHIKTVQRAVVWMENKLVTLESVPCGNTVAVFGLDEWTSKNVTLTTEERLDAHSIHAIKFLASQGSGMREAS